MPLPELIRKHRLSVDGVLHVGAHLAEEAPVYDQCRCGSVTWVEANPAVIARIEANLAPYSDQRVIEALVYSSDGLELGFNVSNYDGMSSSVLEFGTHPTFSPDTVFVEHLQLRTTTIDTLVAEHAVKANLLSMDIQGAELHALRGATRFLADVDYILSEVNRAEVYLGCAQVGQLEDFLAPDFTLVEAHWVADQGWGDALWVRR